MILLLPYLCRTGTADVFAGYIRAKYTKATGFINVAAETPWANLLWDGCLTFTPAPSSNSDSVNGQ